MRELTWNELSPEQQAALNQRGLVVLDEAIPRGEIEFRSPDRPPVRQAVEEIDWGSISEAKQAEADRYYGRGHSAGHTPTADGVDKRRAKRKAQKAARRKAR